MADEPRNENQEAPAEPVHVDATDPRADARDKSRETVEQEAIDDDRFEATDN